MRAARSLSSPWRISTHKYYRHPIIPLCSGPAWTRPQRPVERPDLLPPHHPSSSSFFTPRSKSTTTPPLPLPALRASAPHTDLSSFLLHAARTNLDRSSKVYVGTRFEYGVQALLTTTYGFTLTRVAGTNDRGIDLLGYWGLPPHHQNPVRVIVQCKKATSKLQPRVVRELEGSFAGAPPGWNDEESTLAVLVGTGDATKGIREAMRSSGVGVVWMSVTEGNEEGGDGDAGMGRVRQMLWNERARQMALEGIDVVMRHDRDGGEELRLMWQGRLVPKGKNGRVSEQAR